jgi:PncC family amidohydrolase
MAVHMLEEILHEHLHSQRKTIACAESCTGGLVSHRITNVPGSSEYFQGGVIAYSYEAKADMLGVPWDTLNTSGAVSEQTVREMARRVRALFKVDLALSVSGIAGPGGGTDEKPVGTTWICLAAAEGEWTRQFVWSGDRERNKLDSSEAALQLAVEYLEGRLE